MRIHSHNRKTERDGDRSESEMKKNKILLYIRELNISPGTKGGRGGLNLTMRERVD